MKSTRIFLGLLCGLAFVTSNSVFAGNKDKIIWDTPILEIAALPGSSQIVETSFTTPIDYEQLNLWLTPSLSEFIQILPERVGATADVPTEILLLVSVPADSIPQDYEGTLHIRQDKGKGNKKGRTIPNVLNLRLVVNEIDAQTIPDGPNSPARSQLVQDPDIPENWYVRDEIIVLFDDGVTDTEKGEIVSTVGGAFVGSLLEIGVYQVRLDGSLTVEDAIVLLASDNRVEHSQRRHLDSTFEIPSDPQWEPVISDKSWPQRRIGFPAAWDKTKGDSSTRIAVIDTGFQFDHEDFLSTNGTQKNFRNPTNADPSIFLRFDNELVFESPLIHGTNVAGLIAATADNEKGIAGINWNATVELYPVANVSSCNDRNPDDPIRVSGCTLLPDLAVARMKQAIQNGARIINYSAGYYYDSKATARSRSYIYEQVIRDNPDVLFVIAAGNNEGDVGNVAPAMLSEFYPNVVSVAATGQDNRLTRVDERITSRYGGTTVAAPGELIYTTFPKTRDPAFPGPRYEFTQGTSVAAPLVSGVAGLLVSRNNELWPGSTLKAATIKCLLREGAEQAGPAVADPGGNAHVINAGKSLQLLEDRDPVCFEVPAEVVEFTATGRVVSVVQSSLVGAPAGVTVGAPVRLTLQYNVSDAERYTENVGQSIGRYVFPESEESKISIAIGDLLWQSGVPQVPSDFLVQRESFGHFGGGTEGVPIAKFASFPGRDEVSGIQGVQGIVNFNARGPFFNDQSLDLPDSIDDFNVPINALADGRIVVRRLTPFADLLDIRFELDEDSFLFNGDELAPNPTNRLVRGQISGVVERVQAGNGATPPPSLTVGRPVTYRFSYDPDQLLRGGVLGDGTVTWQVQDDNATVLVEADGNVWEKKLDKFYLRADFWQIDSGGGTSGTRKWPGEVPNAVVNSANCSLIGAFTEDPRQLASPGNAIVGRAQSCLLQSINFDLGWGVQFRMDPATFTLE